MDRDIHRYINIQITIEIEIEIEMAYKTIIEQSPIIFLMSNVVCDPA